MPIQAYCESAVSPDIEPILRAWDFQPDEVTVRSITNDAGEERIQLRLELGILQMHVNGRPDGQRVRDCVSWLDFHQQQQQEHDRQHPDAARYLLEPEDCAELLREGVLYYHRYLSFWHLGRYELCARDTGRNLQLFAFVRDHARHDRDKLQFDQWRPYVTMMHTRAVATPLVELNQFDAALSVIDSGIRGLESFLADYGQQEHEDRLGELQFLKRWRKELLGKSGSPEDEDESLDPMELLRQQLQDAIAEERYEAAADLRDQMRQLEDPKPPQFP